MSLGLSTATEALAAAAALTLEEPRANSLFQLARAALLRGDPDQALDILDEGRQLGLTAAYGWRYELRALDLQATVLVSQGQDASEALASRLQPDLRPRFIAAVATPRNQPRASRHPEDAAVVSAVARLIARSAK